MNTYSGKVRFDLATIGFVLGGKDDLEKKSRLVNLLGKEVVAAVHSLDDPDGFGTAVSAIARANLTQGLRSTYVLFDSWTRDGIVGADDVSDALGVSRSVAANRLTELETLGLIVQVESDNRMRRFRKA